MEGVSEQVVKQLKSIKDQPLKGKTLTTFNTCMKIIEDGIRKNTIKIKQSELTL